MANYTDGRYLNFTADTDLSADLFKIVSVAASANNPTGRTVVVSASATDGNILGVLNNAPKAGETASVCARNAHGTFKVLAGGTIAIGDLLTSDASGNAITTTTAGNELIGKALSAGVSGAVIEYLPCSHKL